MLNHGGQLQKMMASHPEATLPWLDVSTGIAPWSWPTGELPAHVWQALPPAADGLCEAAAGYYGCAADEIIAVSGSQAAIEALPACVPAGAIAISRWGFAEHRLHWERHGHQVYFYDDFEALDSLLNQGVVDHVLVINPNNPSGAMASKEQLARWQQKLYLKGGYLIVDEAFADLDHEQSVLNLDERHNVIVLRSVGKFFGLAGLRLGFVIACESIRRALQKVMPLWSVSHPAIWLGERLLVDRNWQSLQRQRIAYYRDWMADLLRAQLPSSLSLTLCVGPLFISVFGAESVLRDLSRHCASMALCVRFFEPQDNVSCVRFGLVNEAGIARLETTLQTWRYSSVPSA